MVTRRRRVLVLLLTSLALLPASAEGLYAPHAGVVSANPAEHTPNVLDGKVTAILPLGNRIIVGGHVLPGAGGRRRQARPQPPGTVRLRFRHRNGDLRLRGQPRRRPRSAVDRAVEALAPSPDGRSVFVGGSFGRLNGAAVDKLVKLDGTTGAVDSRFDVSVHSNVKDLALSGSRLYVAGGFTTFNGQARAGLAAVDATTGALDANLDIPFTEPCQGTVPRVETIAVSPDGTTLVAAGNFLKAGGQPRVQIAMVDVGTRPARLADWQTDRYDTECSEPGFDSHMRDIDMSPDGSYFVVVTTGGYARYAVCTAASRSETGTRGSGLQPTWWDRSGGDSYTAVAVTARRSTSAATCAGSTTTGPTEPTPTPSPAPAPSPGRASPPSTRATACRCRGTPGGTGARAPGRWSPPPTGSGWAATPTRSPASTTPSWPASRWSAGAPRPHVLVGAPAGGPLHRRRRRHGRPALLRRRRRRGAHRRDAGEADWTSVRGAFAVGDRLYTGRDDGRLQVRTIAGGGFGTPTDVDMYGTPDSQFPDRPPDRHVLRQRPALPHRLRRQPPLLPLVHARERRGRLGRRSSPAATATE